MANSEFDLNGLTKGTMSVKGHLGPKPGDRQFIMVNGKVIADRVVTSATMDEAADGWWEITTDSRPATKADGPLNRKLLWTMRWAYIRRRVRRRVRRLFGLRSTDGERNGE